VKFDFKNFNSIVLIGGCGMFGCMILLFSHRSHIELKKIRDLEYKVVNKKVTSLIEEYEKYREIIEQKKYFITKKNYLEYLINIDNPEKKFTSSLILQKHENLIFFYNKLKILQLELEKNLVELNLLKLETQKYEAEFNLIFKNLKDGYNIDLTINNINQIKPNLEKIYNFFSDDVFKNSNTRLKIKLCDYEITKIHNIKLNTHLNEMHDLLVKQVNKISQSFIDDANEVLKIHINWIEKEIQNLNIEEINYLDLHEDELPV
jgi:hypothetical protein